MKLFNAIAAAAVIGTSFIAANHAESASNCIYMNKAKGTKLNVSCRVITSGKGGDVIFIDEYRTSGVVRHDSNSGWYAPKHRNNDCLLRKQGLESICYQSAWDGI